MSPRFDGEQHSAQYGWRARFPDARVLRLGEGEGTYAAEGEGCWWIIHDSGTLADVLDEEDEGMALITLQRFTDRAEWEAEVQSIEDEDRRQHLRRHYRGHPYAGRRIDVLTHGAAGQRRVRLPLGRIWRSRTTQRLIVMQSGEHRPGEPMAYVSLLDEHGLLDFGEGVLSCERMDAEYELVSDPDEVARLVRRD